MTIEDPVEYHFTGINQFQVHPKADVTFANSLRSFMRLDPDVILVGEVRDSETAKLAIQAALTGHFVFSSIHANDAAGIMFRLLDLGVEPFLSVPLLLALLPSEFCVVSVRTAVPPMTHPSRSEWLI